MAVPPTHDGSVGPRSTSGTFARPALTAVLAVVCVACLLFLGLRYTDASGSFGDRIGQVFGADDEPGATGDLDDPRARELVLSQANQFMIRVNTYGPSDLDEASKMPGYVERVKEVITPKFDVEFEESVTLAEQAVDQTGLERSVQLYASGAESITDDTATVLITGVITQSYPDPEAEGRIEFEPELFRYEVSMVRTGGEWLADDFAPVLGEVEGEPTEGEPTAPPETSSPAVQRYLRVVTGRQGDIEAAVATIGRCGFPEPATSASASCVAVSDDLASAARVLGVALRDAADPDAAGYAGAAPDAVTALAQATRAATADVIAAAQALRPACVVTDSAACTEQRTALADAAANLQAALDGWGTLA